MGIETGKSFVSVIVPVFNGAMYLSEALDSVIAQSFQDFELIVVDDGSTDGTREIVESYGTKIQYVYQDNSGAGAARNNGVAHSSGDYLAFLDADDSWPRTKLEKQVSVLKSNPKLDGVTGYVNNIQQADWQMRNETDIGDSVEMIVGYSPSVILIRRKSFFKVGMFETDSRVGEVVDWIVRAKETGLNIEVLPEMFLRRRIHGLNNGIQNKAFASDYVKALKRSIDRRRSTQMDGQN